MNKGFTMIELLASIIILSIIMVVAIPAYNKVATSLKVQNLENKTKAISLAMQKYASKYLMDEIKPTTTTSCPGDTSTSCPTGTCKNCCQQYDLYKFIVANGIYLAEEEILEASVGELEIGPKIIDPVTNKKIEGCVKVRYTINNSGNNKLESKFVKGCTTSGIKSACSSW